MTSLALAVGQTVELNDGRKAVVRFYGPTGFAPGEWVGIELNEGTGKNDGSVKGERYFDCEPNHGMFLRTQAISRIVSRPSTRRPSLDDEGASASASASAPASAPASASASVSSSTPTPTLPPSGLRSPTKSPTKLTRASTPPSSSVSRTATPPTAPASRRPLTTPAALKPRTVSAAPASSTTAARRTSTVPSSNPAQTPRASAASAAASRLSTARTPAARQSFAPPRQSTLSRQTPAAPRVSATPKDPQSAPSPPVTSPSLAPDHHQNASDSVQSFAPPQKPPTSPAMSQSSQRATKATAREVEDLQTKMKLLDKKRQEDRDKLQKLSNIEQERDKYATIVQKMQSKMQSQSQELADLRSQLKESEASLLNIEAIQDEHDAVVEMATLDREMAEETAEVLKTEVDALRSKNEEYQLELEILREENQELGREMNPDERTSQGWLQMERSNERLREALLRLRDMTQEQEAESKAQISSLEEEVKDFGVLKTDYEHIKEKLLATEADLEDMRQQLDAAMGAEDMIEELTERNMSMQEKIDDLTLVIDDLENLKELNDELEVNHVEAEKQMQEEIDFKDSILSEQSRRSAQQQQAIEDCEYTISRFRELVTSLQADLEDMRASRQITETEAEELSSRSRAMMDLNMKLQLSAVKTQVKTIDLELKRLDAEEATEHLAIVHLFLPEAFQADRDSVLALLRFKRVSFKARLMHSLIKERLGGQGTRTADEDMFAAYGVLDRLAWVAEMGDRFVRSISSCSVADFAKYESALYELEPVERALNTYVDALKRDDLKEGRVDEELQRSMAVMSHLASLHISESLSSSASDMLMQASLIQSHLDSATSALTLCRSLVQSNVPESASSEDNDANLFTQLDALIANVRSSKVLVSKAHRNVQDLQSRSLALSPTSLEQFVSIEQQTSKLAVFGRRAGEKIQNMFGEEGREESFSLGEAEILLARLSTSVFGSSSTEASSFSSLSTYLSSLHVQLTELNELSANPENTLEFERLPAPWVTRSASLRDTKLTSVDTEAEVSRLNEVVRERSLLVRSKEQELEEQSVRIEMLEARMSEAQKRGSQIVDLEKEVQASKEQETALQEQLVDAQKDVARLRRDRDEWRRTAEQHKPDPAAAKTIATEMGGASRMELDRAKLRIDSLESAIRYLQTHKATSHVQKSNSLDWLEAPLTAPSSKQNQRQETLRAEGHSALSELLKLVGDAKPVSLTSLPKNKLAWRPAMQTSKWTAQKKREDWATWQEWERDILDRVQGNTAPRKKIGAATYKDKIEGMNGYGDGVTIVQTEEVM